MSEIGLPAPVGGWNASDGIAMLEPTDAYVLENWIPRAAYVQSRKGLYTHNSGGNLGAFEGVKTLIAHEGTAGGKLLGVVDLGGGSAKIYDVTTADAEALLATVTNAFWVYTHFQNKTIMTNGADTAQVYNGAALAALTITTGPAANTLYGCHTYKGRVYYWKQSAQSFYYCAAGAYQGVLTEFKLDTQLTKGGTLVQMVSITNDGGDGVDDLAAFVFSTGETLVYQGDDPASATAWNLVGRFQLGQPMTIRSHCRLGATEVIFTRDGVVDLVKALKLGRYDPSTAISAKISGAINNAVKLYGSTPYWDCILYPKGGFAIFNVPGDNGLNNGTVTSANYTQYVLNTSNGAWCKWSYWQPGHDVMSMAVLGDSLYFGCKTGVFIADAAFGDGKYYPTYNPADRLYWPIMSNCSQGFTRPEPGRRLQGAAMMPITNYYALSLAQPGYLKTKLAADYLYTFPLNGIEANINPVTIPPYTGNKLFWYTASCYGEMIAPEISILQAGQQVSWYETRVRYKPGGEM